MNRDAIIINSIEKNFSVIQIVGKQPVKTITAIVANFDYKTIRNAEITIDSNKTLSEEEIKDKIIEVINS